MSPQHCVLTGNSLFERLACFYVKTNENFERFQFFDFKTNFQKNANSSQKTGILFSSVLVESTKIKNATVPYKSVLSKANVETYKTNFPVNFAKFLRASFLHF